MSVGPMEFLNLNSLEFVKLFSAGQYENNLQAGGDIFFFVLLQHHSVAKEIL